MDFVEILSASLGAPGFNSHNASSTTPNSTSSAPAPNPQFALIDLFIPGFSGLSNVIRHHFGIDVSLYIPVLAFIFGTTFVWGRVQGLAWYYIEEHLVSSVRIRTDDEIYNIMIAWIAKQSFSQRSRKFFANTNINSRDYYSYSYDSDSEDEDDYRPDLQMDGPVNAKGQQKPLHYTPADGSHYFFYKGSLMLFQRDRKNDRSSHWASSAREELLISSFGRSPKALKKLLCDAREEYMKKDESKTVIYRGAAGTLGSEPSWQRCMSRSTRPLSTVILNEKVKKDLVEDVADYLNPATRRWYANRGIPYRRGYLLHGPPGTGKSSLSLALAGHFRMRIYIVSLSSVVANEENLASLFVDLPRRCLVLLEDIDSAGLTHLRDDGEAPANGAAAPLKLPMADNDDDADEVAEGPMLPGAPPAGGRLSLSGLLNILDGVASQEGRLLVMTTNHLEKLDKALVRPGRVDRIVHFDLADSEMAASVFRAIYALYEGESEPHARPSAATTSPSSMLEDEVKKNALREQARKDERARIERLALEFGQKLPSLEFSPAEIQGLLLLHKRDPEGAVAALDEWVEKTRQDKKEKELEEAERRRKAEEELKKQAEKKAEKKKEKEEKKSTVEEKREKEYEETKKKDTDNKSKDEKADNDKAGEKEEKGSADKGQDDA